MNSADTFQTIAVIMGAVIALAIICAIKFRLIDVAFTRPGVRRFLKLPEIEASASDGDRPEK